MKELLKKRKIEIVKRGKSQNIEAEFWYGESVH
jgi:hypothetical protein